MHHMSKYYLTISTTMSKSTPRPRPSPPLSPPQWPPHNHSFHRLHYHRCYVTIFTTIIISSPYTPPPSLLSSHYYYIDHLTMSSIIIVVSQLLLSSFYSQSSSYHHHHHRKIFTCKVIYVKIFFKSNIKKYFTYKTFYKKKTTSLRETNESLRKGCVLKIWLLQILYYEIQNLLDGMHYATRWT